MPLKEVIDFVESKSGYSMASMMSLNCVVCRQDFSAGGG